MKKTHGPCEVTWSKKAEKALDKYLFQNAHKLPPPTLDYDEPSEGEKPKESKKK